ncbi:hypothetical protein D2E76_16370 [Mycobacteroides abscessus]|uniref:Uncharacterized protein n=1 Tax=Mycobacteroides abscessus TaxID=36809 RepID=A0ABD7HM35_9MYCO|nr:hypothetical protein [Mycobacteroides abscessus]RIT36827.1 hypothetical protein D2E76_16370 [Mycobacteroides abscessus]
MTDTQDDTYESTPSTADEGDPAPANIEEASSRLARITGELNERKAAAEKSADRFTTVEHEAQIEIDELTRKALIEIRDVKRRLDADIAEAQTRLTEKIAAAGRERDEDLDRYATAIDTVVASGLFTRRLLKGMGYWAIRKKTTTKPVVSKITAKDLED